MISSTWQICTNRKKNPFYCGVASMVTVLNALRANKGTIPSQEGLYFDLLEADGNIRHIPYQLYSQKTFLNDETDKVKDRAEIWPKNYEETDHSNFNPGLDLDEVKKMLKIYDAKVTVRYADDEIDTGIDRFRNRLKKHLLDDDHFMIANFDGQILGAHVGGHYSTVAAFHERTDSVLLLDPAAHKNPWYWAPLPHLYFAMHTKAGDKFRGYLIVSDKQ